MSSILLRRFPEPTRYLLRSDNLNASIEAFKNLPETQRHRYQLLRGHQPFGLHAYLAPGARYLTVIRDPVARIVSHYDYVIRQKHPAFYQQIRSRDMSLAEYAASGISGELENGQTRWLAGILDDRPLTPADLQTALQNIHTHFDWVGLTEHFDECLIDLAIQQRWLNVTYRKRKAKRTGHQQIPDATANIIRERNQLDLQLYAHIQQGFEYVNPAYAGFRRFAGNLLRRFGERPPRRRYQHQQAQ